MVYASTDILSTRDSISGSWWTYLLLGCITILVILIPGICKCALVTMSPRPNWMQLISALRRNRYQYQPHTCFTGARISRRWQSNSVTNSRPVSWTTGRVLLISAFASSLAYLYGVIDARPLADQPVGKHTNPRYGSNKDLTKVCFIWNPEHSSR